MPKCFLLLVAIFFTAIKSHAQAKAVKDSLEWEMLSDSAESCKGCTYGAQLIVAQSAIKKASETFGKKSRNYAISLNDLSVINYNLQKFQDAKENIAEALDILKNNITEHDDSDYYATTLNVYAVVKESLNDYTNVEELYKQSMEIRERLFTQNSKQYLESLNNLALLYRNIGYLPLAEKTIKKTVDIQMQLTGKDYEYAKKLHSLGSVVMSEGQYSNAEIYFKEALSIIDTTSSNGDARETEYGNTLNDLATLYTSMNNYAAAKDVRKKVLVHLIKMLHRKTADYAITSTRLAKLYIETGNYDTAFSLLQDADTIFQKELNTDSSLLYAETLDQIALLYYRQNDFTNAAMYYQKAKNIKEKILGKSHSSYAESLNSLGELAIKKENYAEAKEYLDSAADIRLHQLGKEHPDYSESVNNILNISYARNNFENWNKNISYAITTWQNSVMHLLLSFDEWQKENYLDNHLAQKDVFLSMLYYFQQNKNIDKLNRVYYKMITALQGWLLSGSRQLNAIVGQQHDEFLSKLYDRWIIVKKQYTSAIQLSLQKQKELQLNADSLLQLSQQMEMNLISRLPSLRENLKEAGAFPSAVSHKLKTNEAFINWVSFKYKSPQHLTDSTLYGSFILLPKDTIAHFIVLFEENQLKKLLKYYHNGTGRGILKPASSIVNKNVDKELYQLIWKPLLPYIKKTKIIYTIPSGDLDKVSFVALADSTNKTLLQTTALHFLSNVEDLIKSSFNNQSVTHTIALFGGADFNGKNNILQASDNDVFPYLPGTRKEVDSLAKLFNNKKWKVQLHTVLSASEKNFKEYSGSKAPFILHIATHGFYLQHPSSTASDFPLLRSGFILSGANMFWKNGRTATPGSDDGIVTAQEVSNLNFEKTNLVTLSACETALGDINNTEGVYGLRRAFKIAGAKNMLITLWQIPDEPTRELMNIFYKNVLRGNSYYEALRNAQNKIKEKYPDPSVWAGFQLIGE